MISFIIIGKNIEPTAKLCFDSVFRFIDKNKIKHYEVIYSDSNSTDKTLYIVEKYPVSVIRLKGECNAAIGRNEGAKRAKGNIYFFLDGDMELEPDCYNLFFCCDSKLVYPFFRGLLLNKYYTPGFKKIIKQDPPIETGSENEYSTRINSGGLIVVYAEYWHRLGGMDPRLDANEDTDFGIRMSSLRIKQRIYNVLMVYHHMVSYYDLKRLFLFLSTKRFLYSGVLLRKHIFNKRFIYFFLRSRYSCILLIVAFLSLFNLYFFLGLISGYILLQLLRSIRTSKKEDSLLYVFLFKLLYDLNTIVGFILFYPANKKYRVETLNTILETYE